MVSIIIPMYNATKYIRRAIDSVIAQTFSQWDLWIIDDCSTDLSVDIVRSYKDPRIHLFVRETRGGAAYARNLGILFSSGKYVAFLDSDDIWEPDKLEKQIRFMEENHIAFSCTAYRTSEGNVITPPKEITYEMALKMANPIGNLTAIYNREMLGAVYAPLIRKRNDFALWLKILKTGVKCYGMPEVLATYQIRKDSLSSKKISLLYYHWKLYYQIEHLGFWKSFYYMFCCFWEKLGRKKK